MSLTKEQKPSGRTPSDTQIADAATSLIEFGRAVSAAGLGRGSSGNMSVRISDDVIAMTPRGSSLAELDAASMSIVTLSGTLLGGETPSKELPLHAEMYRKNPTHRAVIHVHSPAAIAASCLPPWSEASALPPLTPYFVMRAGQTPLVSYAAPGSDELAENLARVRVPFSSALLQNHGQITSGETLARALDAAIEVEEAAHTTLLTAGHAPRILTPAEAESLAQRYGTFWTPENC